MAELKTLFATRVYRTALGGTGAARLNKDLHAACRSIARDDRAGQSWSREHNYRGYTSYASLNDLAYRAPPFAELERRLAKHAATFARALHFDLAGRKLKIDSLWINILKPGGVHTGHIHPHSVISGTYYVAVPRGASALKFEDPRLGHMMAAPPRKKTAPRETQPFVYVAPKPGQIILFESWLRHEVPPNDAREDRISISFNYAWV